MYNKSKGEVKVPLLAIGNNLTLLGVFASEMDTFIEHSMQIWPHELKFVNVTQAKESIIYSELDDDDIRGLDFLYLIASNLKYMIPFHLFENSFHLKNSFNILTHSFCLYGLNFVSSIQAKEFPIAAITYQPQSIAFEQNGQLEVKTGAKAIRMARLMGDSLVNYARKNNRTMTLEEKKEYDYIRKTM